MRITRVETIFVLLPMAFRYAGGAALAAAGVLWDYSGSLLIKLHTDQAAEWRAFQRYVEAALAPVLL